MAAKEYQGFPSWNAWNVSLYIHNEEPLYRAAVEAIRNARKSSPSDAPIVRNNQIAIPRRRRSSGPRALRGRGLRTRADIRPDASAW